MTKVFKLPFAYFGPPTKTFEMAIYYRFQHEAPRPNEKVHCFTTRQGLKDFVEYMRKQDPLEFHRMKYWEVEGSFIEHDEGDAIVQVFDAKEIHL